MPKTREPTNKIHTVLNLDLMTGDINRIMAEVVHNIWLSVSLRPDRGQQLPAGIAEDERYASLNFSLPIETFGCHLPKSVEIVPPHCTVILEFSEYSKAYDLLDSLLWL